MGRCWVFLVFTEVPVVFGREGECETKWLIVVYRKLRRVNIIIKLQRETVKVTVCVVLSENNI